MEKTFYKEPTLIPIETNNEPIIDIFCGFRQSFFISKSNGIWCSGYNKFSELGFENEYDNFCYFTLKLNGFFQNTNIKIIKIETGQKFTCLLDSKEKLFVNFKNFLWKDLGNLYGWGDNKHGQLNSKEKTGKPQIIFMQVEDFSLGWHHTLILTSKTSNLKKINFFLFIFSWTQTFYLWTWQHGTTGKRHYQRQLQFDWNYAKCYFK